MVNLLKLDSLIRYVMFQDWMAFWMVLVDLVLEQDLVSS